MRFENKQDYIDQRNALLAEAENLLKDGKVDEYEKKEQAIKDLDNAYEDYAKNQANLNALKDKVPVQTDPVDVGNGNKEKIIIDAEKEDKLEAAKRGAELKRNNVVTVSSGNIVTPSQTSSTINPTFNEVSSLIDRVTIKPLKGGESYKEPYVKGYGTGGNTTEGADYTDAEVQFDYAEMNKAKITAYAEDTEEITKLPDADYDAEVQNGVRIASRKKMTRDVLVGDGATNHFVGIFSAKATAIDSTTDKEIAAIDKDTLNEIIFSYGGDEEVEDAAVLVLNKLDLKAFSQLKTTDGHKYHDIVSNGNTGTIDGIPFTINSACKAISDTNTVAGDYSMAYGPLSNYTVAIFSDTDIKRSEDYKFKQGIIAHRASTFAGGNVTSYNGFLRIKKASQA